MQTYIEQSNNPTPLSELFKNELIRQGRTITWLCKSMDFTHAHVSNMLRNVTPITEKSRIKMNELLSTDFQSQTSSDLLTDDHK